MTSRPRLPGIRTADQSDPYPAHPAKGERVNSSRERQQTSRGWDYAVGRDMFRATN